RHVGAGDQERDCRRYGEPHEDRPDRADDLLFERLDRHRRVLPRPGVWIELRPHPRRLLAHLREGRAGSQPPEQTEAPRVGGSIEDDPRRRSRRHPDVDLLGWKRERDGMTPAIVSGASPSVTAAPTRSAALRPDWRNSWSLIVARAGSRGSGRGSARAKRQGH